MRRPIHTSPGASRLDIWADCQAEVEAEAEELFSLSRREQPNQTCEPRATNVGLRESGPITVTAITVAEITGRIHMSSLIILMWCNHWGDSESKRKSEHQTGSRGTRDGPGPLPAVRGAPPEHSRAPASGSRWASPRGSSEPREGTGALTAAAR